MKKIGSVIYEESLVNHKQVEYINYIHKSDMNEEIPYMPTLFVGWKFFKSTYSSQEVTILNKEVIKNDLLWEFSFNENKQQHVSGINMFVRNAPIFFFESKYEYKLIDPVHDIIEDIDGVLNRIPNDCKGMYIYKDKMAYILKDKTIYGVDLEMFHFFDLHPLMESLKNKTNQTHQDTSGDIFAKYNKIFNGYDNLKRYLVTIL